MGGTVIGMGNFLLSVFQSNRLKTSAFDRAHAQINMQGEPRARMTAVLHL